MKTKKTKILLVYPEIPTTYWSFRYTLDIIGRKSLLPPLGLITVAALLPENYEPRLIDMNVEPLSRDDVLGADMVFVSAMIVQKESLAAVVRLCNDCGVPVAAGGPYPTSSRGEISGVDHFVLNEAEITLPRFLADLEAGRAAAVYADDAKPDLSATPVPRYDLLKLDRYHNMAVQASRGCPFSCEFCDIIEMFGRVPRYKSPERFVMELDAIHRTGFRGSIFVVDDNFIGNKKRVRELLVAVISWQRSHGRPFSLYTEASVNLAADDGLMRLMVDAGFDSVFVGIETPVPDTLAAAGKGQNVHAELLQSVEKIQRAGMEVMGGFIVGFDGDPGNIFDLQVDFIRRAAIPMAMVGTLTALPGTALHRRLEREGRLLSSTDGDNTGLGATNFVTRMGSDRLSEGYGRIVSVLYGPASYFRRCRELLKRMPARSNGGIRVRPWHVAVLLKSIAALAFTPAGPRYLWLLLTTLVRRPSRIADAVALGVKGRHVIQVTRDMLSAASFSRAMAGALAELSAIAARAAAPGVTGSSRAIEREGLAIIRRLRRKHRGLVPGAKRRVLRSYEDFLIAGEIIVHDAVLRYLRMKRLTAGKVSFSES